MDVRAKKMHIEKSIASICSAVFLYYWVFLCQFLSFVYRVDFNEVSEKLIIGFMIECVRRQWVQKIR